MTVAVTLQVPVTTVAEVVRATVAVAVPETASITGALFVSGSAPSGDSRCKSSLFQS